MPSDESIAVNLKKLIKQRSSIKAQVTRGLSYVTEATNLDKEELKARRDRVEQLCKQYEEIQTLIEDVDDKTDYTYERFEFEQQFIRVMSVLARRIHALQLLDMPSSSAKAPEATKTIMVKQADTLLPKIEIRPFDGNPVDWHSFHDTFKSLVHENAELLAVQKFHLLKNSLRGEVSSVIASLNATERNYVVAWDLLQKRCNKPRQIVHAHLRLLLDLPDLARESPGGLKSLAEHAQMHVNALNALNQPVHHWDTILVFILVKKLDKATRRAWERTLDNEDMPTFNQLLDFINKQARGDEIESEFQTFKNNSQENKFRVKNLSHGQAYTATGSQYNCLFCNRGHPIYQCQQFLQLSARERSNAARKAKLCLNCLQNNHITSNCKLGGCRKCNRKHNTLLHFSETTKSKPFTETDNKNTTPSDAIKTTLTVSCNSEVLLGTAQVKILDKYNKEHSCRVLLDGGSQSHFITQKLADKLQLSKQKIDLAFSGLNELNTRAEYSIQGTLKSSDDSFITNVNLVVLPTITGLLPSRAVNRSLLSIPNKIKLADPEFHRPKEIDVLLGNTLFYQLLSIGQIKLCNNSIILQKTRLGWIITGEINLERQFMKSQQFCHVATSLEKQINKFWEIEEIPNKRFLSPLEAECERHFVENTVRDEDGRFIVRLPFNDKREFLGESKGLALKRFYALENKLHKNPILWKQYSEFLEEYQSLGHMREIKSIDKSMEGFYLPHHAVLKESSATTKIRVVFDASAKSSTGVSLNDALMIGPTIQDSLFAILLRFRLHEFVMTADIEKMFRQIKLHPDDTVYQKILWRDSIDKPIKTFSLQTVTYGTASAPFLAVRSLDQLAIDASEQFRIASQIFKRDFYVDDLLTEASSLKEALELRNELLALAKTGGFNLRQWTSNNTKLVEDLEQQTNLKTLTLDSSEPKKTLGVFWNATKDCILYTVKPIVEKQRVTKRTILSQVSKLFDPLGILGPVIIQAKLIIQLLWKANIDWDQSVPQEIHYLWTEFKTELELLNNFSASRNVTIKQPVSLQLHGFCDASEKAYGACIYIRSSNKHGNHQVYLLCAKSRVAPLKTISLPRLELCAAKLLANLYKETVKALTDTKFNKIMFWSDSTITLNWIRKAPHLLETFEANRVNEIQNITEIHNWSHVVSKDNPADFISRGQSPSQLLNNHVWLKGPNWLSGNEECWPPSKFKEIEVPGMRKLVSLTASKDLDDFLERFSDIRMLNRVFAWILRYINRIKNKTKITGKLTATEIQDAHIRVIRLVQSRTFDAELKELRKGNAISKNSKLLSLNPFIDNNNLLRVGGRLQHASINYAQKHPILLPHKHPVTDLIIRNEHLKHWHAGTQATLNAVRQRYWPLNGKKLIRRIIHCCIRCCKFNPITPQYLMGELPINRVTQARPFQNVGVDYCGPFLVKETKLRNRTKIKIYVAVFDCFATKAVHLETASDLTTEACLGALKRFLARRGKPRNIYSDNATNFIGTKNEFLKLKAFVASEEYKEKMQYFSSNENIDWHFTPPRSPHFGGLWEAAVKSFKKHFYKTIGDVLLTYEQFNTLTTEIEAILNSRPLTPLSSDPNDFTALTPGHFLIGDSLSNIPEHDLADVVSNRWHKEYLHELHTRNKWHLGDTTRFKEGALVTIREDDLPPMRWPLGRIIKIHPGEDNIVRVATVRTQHGTYKRSIKRLSPLPVDSI